MAGDLKSFVASAVGLEEAARGRFLRAPRFPPSGSFLLLLGGA